MSPEVLATHPFLWTSLYIRLPFCFLLALIIDCKILFVDNIFAYMLETLSYCGAIYTYVCLGDFNC